MAADVSNGAALPKQVVQTAALQTLVACMMKLTSAADNFFASHEMLWFRCFLKHFCKNEDKYG
jgi:hypothetical protein